MDYNHIVAKYVLYTEISLHVLSFFITPDGVQWIKLCVCVVGDK